MSWEEDYYWAISKRRNGSSGSKKDSRNTSRWWILAFYKVKGKSSAKLWWSSTVRWSFSVIMPTTGEWRRKMFWVWGFHCQSKPDWFFAEVSWQERGGEKEMKMRKRMIQEESKMLCVFRCSLTNSGIRVTLGNVVFYQNVLYLRINECMIFNCFYFRLRQK